MAKLSQYSLTVEVTPRSYILVEIVQGCLWGHTHILIPQTLSLFPFPTFSPSPPSESCDLRKRCKEFSVYFFIISSWSIIFLKWKLCDLLSGEASLSAWHATKGTLISVGLQVGSALFSLEYGWGFWAPLEFLSSLLNSADLRLWEVRILHQVPGPEDL